MQAEAEAERSRSGPDAAQGVGGAAGGAANTSVGGGSGAGGGAADPPEESAPKATSSEGGGGGKAASPHSAPVPAVTAVAAVTAAKGSHPSGLRPHSHPPLPYRDSNTTSSKPGTCG